MKYVSTRGEGAELTFSQAVLTGLARDGGLLLPATIPDVGTRLEAWSKLSYGELALEIMRLYIDDIDAAALRGIISKSYATFRHPETTPVVSVGDLHILELFHGPTLAFKDVALQFLGNLFEHILARTGQKLNIVAATSGDTGSAAIQGLRGRDGIRIFVMHPDGRVSPIQKLQMTSVLDANVFNIAIDGTFDDCQDIVKEMMSDLGFRDRHQLGVINSINWARVLAQIVYYFYAAFRVMEARGLSAVRFSVPTGNFGDIFAGYIAWKMGLPIDKLFLATNENDILRRCFATGIYQAGEVAATLSPSMDIQVASNFERYLYYHAGEDSRQVAAWMAEFKSHRRIQITAEGGLDDPVIAAGSCDRLGTLEAIRRYWCEHEYLLDPHTAAGVRVAEELGDSSLPTICLATAHPAKFGEAILEATGEDIAHHPILEALKDMPTRCRPLPASRTAVAEYVADICS